MKIAVLGTGMVGNALATKLIQCGHQVMMRSRTANSRPAQEWKNATGEGAQIGTFADAAAFGELIISCTNGANSVAALRQAGEANLRGKILIDVSNPLDMSQKPPTLVFCNTDSLGERIQREFPETIVVKGLNTVNCDVMVNPGGCTRRS
jgi:predicted dinucleotide-binding enzyme